MQKKKQIIDLKYILKKNLSIKHTYSELLARGTHQITLGPYNLTGYLGEGSYGQVFKAIHFKNQRFVAVKIINKELMWLKNPSEYVQEKLKRFLKTEQTLMKKCHSAFVVKLIETFQSQKLKIFVMELCEGGNLESMIQQKQGLEQNDAIQIIRQILLGLAELHRNKIIHRDLKPANILIHHGIFKITDFGFSTQIQFQDQQQNRTRLGTRSTMAPEVKNNKQYGLKADIWSIGMIYFMMLQYQTKLNDRHQTAFKMIEHKQQFKFRTITKEFISAESQDFLARTLQIKTHKRANWEQILEHRLFKKQFERLPLIYMPLSNAVISKVNRLSLGQEDIGPLLLDTMQFTIFIDNIAQEVPQAHTQSNFQQLTSHYLQCRKSEFIYLDIIKQIQQKKLLNLQKRSHIQLLVLLIHRCFNNIKRSKQKIAKLYDHQISENFNGKIKKLQENISVKYEQYNNMYNVIKQKFKYKLSDLFYSIFKPKRLQQKSRFLRLQQDQSGISGYTKEQQIKYTVEKYLVDIINQLDGNQEQTQTIKNIFKSYHKINFFQSVEIENQSIKECFQKIVQEYEET